MQSEAGSRITICMGSSCFARGNNRNVAAVRDYLEQLPLPPGVEVSGHLCMGHCKQGPNVSMNGTLYHGVDAVAITGLIDRCAEEGPPCKT